MRAKLQRLTLLITVCMLAALLAGCGINNQPDKEVNELLPSADSLVIAGPGRALTAGETYQLLWDFSPAGSARETVIWQCSDEGVVTVSPDGLMTAQGEGSCTITGTTESGLTGSVEVSVKLPETPKLVLDSPDHIEMEEGETYQLKWHFVPETSTPPAVTWETETPEYLEVDENGLLTAKTRLATSVIGTYGTAENRKTVKVTVEIYPPEWELVGFNYQTIPPGRTLEFRYPNKAVTNRDGERVEPGRFVVWDSFNDPAFTWTLEEEPTLEKSFPTVEKKKGNTTIASVTFDTPGGYKVTYSGNGWNEECFILVMDGLMPDTLNLKTGESGVLIDVSSLDFQQRLYLELRGIPNDRIAICERWEEYGNPEYRDVCRVIARNSGSFTIGLYDIFGNCLDTCRVTITGEEVVVPQVWGSLRSVSENSAVIYADASGSCTIVAALFDPDIDPENAPYDYNGNPVTIKERQTVPNSTEALFTFNGLIPGKTYKVHVHGSLLEENVHSRGNMITFTTLQALILKASLKDVNETSAIVTVESDGRCTLISGLYPGDSKAPTSADDIQSNALQHKTIADTLKENIIYEGLTPDTSYSVFVYGIDEAGRSSQLQRVDFTTDKKSGQFPNPGPKPGSGSGSGSNGSYTAVPVTAITGIPAQLLVNQVVVLNPVVQPANASVKAITWSIPEESTGNIALNGSSLTGIAASTPDKPAVLRATIYRGGNQGADYVQDFPVQVLPLVTLTRPEGLKPEGENMLPPIRKDDSGEYKQEFTATGGMGGPYQFELKDSTLPEGWRLDAGQSGENNTAVLTGIPGITGKYSFTVRVTDGAGNFTDYAFALEVSESAFVPVTDITGIPDYMIEKKSITLNGVVQPDNASNRDIKWEITDEFHNYYTLTGNELTSIGGTGTANLRATIKNGLSDRDYTKDFQIEIVYPIALQIPVDKFLTAQVNEEYEQLFKAVNGKPGETSYSFEIIKGSLPEGLVFDVEVSGNNTRAKLTGTPENDGNFEFTVRVKDSDENFTDFDFSLVVKPAVVSNNLLQMPILLELPEEKVEDMEESPDSDEDVPEQPVKEGNEKEDDDRDSGQGENTPSNATPQERTEGENKKTDGGEVGDTTSDMEVQEKTEEENKKTNGGEGGGTASDAGVQEKTEEENKKSDSDEDEDTTSDMKVQGSTEEENKKTDNSGDRILLSDTGPIKKTEEEKTEPDEDGSGAIPSEAVSTDEAPCV